MNQTIKIAAIAALLCVGVTGCASKKTKPGPDTSTTDRTATTERSTDGKYQRGISLENDPCLRQRVVYFDFDRSEIKGEFQAQINCHAEYLRQFPDARVTLEGNADERGTREYNLALGARRAAAARDYLVSLGVSGARLQTVSYGKERPLDPRSNEEAWSVNRNAHAQIVSGAVS